MQIDSDILITGAGHAGLLLGAALARQGWRTLLLDPDPPARIQDSSADGRSLALLRGSEEIVRSLGLWPAVEPVASPIVQAGVTDTASGRTVSYPPQADGRPYGWGLEGRGLRATLLEPFLARAGAAALLQGRAAAMAHGAGHRILTLDDGRRIRTRLLVGADGRGSTIRRLAGIGIERWGYGQTALACILGHDRPHGDAVAERLRPGGPLALLPLRGRRSGVTWVEPDAAIPALRALTADALLARLAAELGEPVAGLRLEAGPAYHPLSAQHARRYVAPRLVLVGDAAHGVHPIHAQGFNMGIADIGALAELLAPLRARDADPGGTETLLAYERRRRPANAQKIRLTDGLNRLFSTDLPPARLARAAAMQALELLPPLKRLAVAQGMRGG